LASQIGLSGRKMTKRTVMTAVKIKNIMLTICHLKKDPTVVANKTPTEKNTLFKDNSTCLYEA
jgi:glutamate synthase domain-containing protein 2